MCFFFRWYNYYLASLILVNLDSRCYGFPVFAFRSRWLITKVISVCVLVIHRQSFVALTSDLSLSLARTQHNTTQQNQPGRFVLWPIKLTLMERSYCCYTNVSQNWHATTMNMVSPEDKEATEKDPSAF